MNFDIESSASIEDTERLKDIALQMKQDIMCDQDVVVTLTANRSFISKLFPSDIDRLIDSHNLQRLGSHAQAQHKKMEIYQNFMLGMATVEANALLKSRTVSLESQMGGFIAAEFNKLNINIANSTSQFAAVIEPQSKLLEQSKNNPMLQQMTQKIIEKQMLSYIETIELILANFKTGLHNQVN